jgi:Protein of unknown function (DUF4038)/Putative collagen-binding domain of a collagenase/Immunoglobulin domain
MFRQDVLAAITLVLLSFVGGCGGVAEVSSGPGGAETPSITEQPSNQTVMVGQMATFTAAAASSAPVSYQWSKSGASIAGATQATYTTPPTALTDNGASFQVVISNSAGSITSRTATLTVTADPTAPSIVTQPVSQTVSVGQKATFSVIASGTAPLSYQWQKNRTAISGATAASYTTAATTSADNGATFAVVVSNSAGSATSHSVTLTVQSVAGQAELMSLSANGKYLVNTFTGEPVFVVGDDAFDLAVMLNSSEVTTYLSDRAGRGFNAIWVAAADNGYQANPPENNYGYAPFDGADFTNEDANYWANVDSVVTQASNLGITVFLQPFFVGNGSESGYYSSVLDSSDAVMTAYGTFLGNRYKNYDNIVWLLGGDSFPSVSGLYEKLNDVGAAIAAADPNHLITLEGCEMCTTDGYNSVQAYQAQSLAVPSWLGLNWAYPQLSTTIAAAQNAYLQTPFLPPLCGENFYELEHSMTGLELRFEQYSEVLSGCYVGRIFGNGAIWSFDSPNGSTCCTNGSPSWQSQLSSVGSVSQEYQGRLFSSREHWLLVPDINHSVVTAGYGTGLTMTTAARTSDGQTIIAYIPNGNATTLTVAMSEITSSTNTVQAWWFNPSSGAATSIGTFSNSGAQNFTPPDSNDWVLVLDDASANLPAPGSSAN